MKDAAMWQRCLSYVLPKGPDGQDFVAWVAEETDMSQTQAADLVMDYKRFTYLAASGAVDRPVAPGLVGQVFALHKESGDVPRYRRVALSDRPLQTIAYPRRRDLIAMMAAFEAEFGSTPHKRYWAPRSRIFLWALAVFLLVGGAVASVIDGSLAPLALGGIPALLTVVYILTAGKMAGGDGLSDAARFGGGMGSGGLN